MAEVSPFVWTLSAALAGLGLGFGLVIGAFVARALRRYMRDEGLDRRREGD